MVYLRLEGTRFDCVSNLTIRPIYIWCVPLNGYLAMMERYNEDMNMRIRSDVSSIQRNNQTLDEMWVLWHVVGRADSE